MALQIASLNSGSNGNCYYIGNTKEAVLIDIGISCRETEIRMKQRGLDIKKVKAIFISHEHTDHIRGVSTLANKYGVPVFITSATAQNGPKLIKHLSRAFTADEPIQVGCLQVTPFGKKHDAADPHSFMVEQDGIKVGIITDIGQVCDRVIHYFSQCNAAFLESNYDPILLQNGRYSEYLKQRIRGGLGHISNQQALELFVKHKSPHLTHLFLSHLSKENNSPELAASVFAPHACNTYITIASRYAATEVYDIPQKHRVLTLF